MGDLINARQRFRNLRAVVSATHKYAVGARVLHAVGFRSEKFSFRVTSHLPDGGSGLQYRIRAEHDGHERVALEAALQRPAPEDLT